MLTSKQQELLTYLNRRITIEGVCPSYDEMREALGLHSKSGIHRLILALEERSFIRRMKQRARAIEILKIPNMVHQSDLLSNHQKPYVVYDRRTDPYRQTTQHFESDQHLDPFHTNSEAPKLDDLISPKTSAFSTPIQHLEVPLYGRLSFETSLNLIHQAPVTHVTVPLHMIDIKSQHHYAFIIQGDYMRSHGILDGDLIVFRQTPLTRNGNLLLINYAGRHLLLRKYFQKGQSIALESDMNDHEAKIYSTHQIQVLGTISGVMRNYNLMLS